MPTLETIRKELLQFEIPDLPTYDDQHWKLSGPMMIGSDAHAPMYSAEWMNRFLTVARKYDIPQALFAGDVFDLLAFSSWESCPEMPWNEEMIFAAHFLWVIYHSFPKIYIAPANHERRISRATNGQLSATELIDSILCGYARYHGKSFHYQPERVEVSKYSYSMLDDKWLICHPVHTSVNQLTVANDLAMRYGKHVIAAHSHQFGMGYSRCGRYALIDSGGLFDERYMLWRYKDVSKARAWHNGFVVYRDGIAHAFGPEPFTDWSMYDET